ncbi:uncharacterized protein TNCV_3062801 [Trichonephila clavipes]|nr:uncharacterized protein TNCV_3062801 [Trichonephila clavipes]
MNIDPFFINYIECARRLDNAYTLASENIFAGNPNKNGAEITDFHVSFDGTWLTRGHTSLIGVGCVIDMLTGYVVDFEVMSKGVSSFSWQKMLGQSSAEFSIWPTTGVLLAPCHDELRGPRSDYVRQVALATITTPNFEGEHPQGPPTSLSLTARGLFRAPPCQEDTNNLQTSMHFSRIRTQAQRHSS